MAINFAGSMDATTAEDALLFGDVLDFDPVGGDERTVSFWAYRDVDGGTGDAAILVGKFEDATTTGWDVTYSRFPPNYMFVRAFDGTNTVSRRCAAPANSVWVHIVATMTGTTAGGYNLYFDGVAQSMTTYTGGTLSSTCAHASPFAIGARGDTQNFSFDGKIADVRVYDRVLSTAEILTITNARGTDGIVDGLLFRAELGGVSGATVTAADVLDVSGAGNDASSIVGSPTFSAGVLRVP